MIRGLKTVCRPIERTDQAFIQQLNADPVVRSNVVGWAFPASLEQQERWFQADHDDRTQRWVVEDLAGERIGLTGLWDIDWHSRNALTALKIGGRSPRRGEGLGTDAIMAVMAFAFYDVGLERLYTTILEDNSASLTAYIEHCGWSVEGRARRHAWRGGRYVDVVHAGVLRSDFESLERARPYIELTRSDASSRSRA